MFVRLIFVFVLPRGVRGCAAPPQVRGGRAAEAGDRVLRHHRELRLAGQRTRLRGTGGGRQVEADAHAEVGAEEVPPRCAFGVRRHQVRRARVAGSAPAGAPMCDGREFHSIAHAHAHTSRLG